MDLGNWHGRAVLVTGHTGFKGAWLSAWLTARGARVWGLSDTVPTAPSLYASARLGELLAGDRRGDVQADAAAVEAALRESGAKVVFHLAAQALVRRSYREPGLTYHTNVCGTSVVLEQAAAAGVAVTCVVTSDKCYRNDGRTTGYAEHDHLGGHDPYSASKAAAEIVTDSFRQCHPDMAVVSVRGGNVIGGGDFAEDRIVPDLVRAQTGGAPVRLRNPHAVRPWQDVRDCLGAYLGITAAAITDPKFGRPFNVGPAPDAVHEVQFIATEVSRRLGDVPVEMDPGPHPVEAPMLTLDASALRAALAWQPRITLDQTFDDLAVLYRSIIEGGDVRAEMMRQLAAFEAAA